MALNVGVNGLGRIGRNVLRVLASNEKLRSNIKVVSLNDPGVGGLEGVVRLLRRDSLYGKFPVEVVAKGSDTLFIEGLGDIEFVADNNIPRWDEKNVKLVLESSGKFTVRDNARKHLDEGRAERVLVSAPADNADATLIFGVNHNVFNRANHYIISGASCTTNCLAPLAVVIETNFGIKFGTFTSIHPYTNDQLLLDGSALNPRLGRSALLSSIPIASGVGKVIGLVLPNLINKFDGMTWRVPTNGGSALHLQVMLEKTISVGEINKAFYEASQNDLFSGIIGYSNDNGYVSVDAVGDVRSSIFDATLTARLPGNMYRIVSFYDNEYGYAAQYVRLADYIASQLSSPLESSPQVC